MRVAKFEVEIEVFMNEGQTLEEIQTLVSSHLVRMEDEVLDLSADIVNSEEQNHVHNS